MLKVDAKGNKIKETCTVFLVDDLDDQWHPFFCHDCRTQILQYKGDIVSISPGVAPKNIGLSPIMVQCRNPNCNRKYQFMGGVKK